MMSTDEVRKGASEDAKLGVADGNAEPEAKDESQCRKCSKKFTIFVKPKTCTLCQREVFCKSCMVPTTALGLKKLAPDVHPPSKPRLCPGCNVSAKIPRLKNLRRLFCHAINSTGSYPVNFPIKNADGWHRLYWIVHSELRKIQRFNNDAESLNIFDPAAPTWSSCIDEIYALSNKSASLSVTQLGNQLYVQKMYLLQTDATAYNKLVSCISKFQNANSSEERRHVIRFLMQIIFSKMKTLLLGLLQHEVAFRIRNALAEDHKLAETFLKWFIFGERKVLQSLLQIYLHAKHDPLGFAAWLYTFGRSSHEVLETLNQLSADYDVFTCEKRTRRGAPKPKVHMTARLKREIEAKTKNMGENVNGHKDLLSVLFALMRDRIREGKAGRRIKNISNFIKGFLLAANGADLEEGERQRGKVQFHDMKQYTSLADASLLFYTRCAVAAYGPLLLNGVFYKDYPPANLSAAKGQGTPFQYRMIFRHTGIHKHQIIHAQWSAYDFNPPHFVAVIPHRREVVVSIRGSMNLRDAITDVMAAELPFPGSPHSLTHAGFLLAARVKLSILGPLLADVMKRNPSLKRVVIVGHSLGAAITTLMALLFKRRYSYLSVAAYAIASPPVLSMPLARDILKEVDVRSFVFRHDIVPRLCLASLDMLKERVSKALATGKELISTMLEKTKRERKLAKRRREVDSKLLMEELSAIEKANGRLVTAGSSDDEDAEDTEDPALTAMDFSDIVNAESVDDLFADSTTDTSKVSDELAPTPNSHNLSASSIESSSHSRSSSHGSSFVSGKEIATAGVGDTSTSSDSHSRRSSHMLDDSRKKHKQHSHSGSIPDLRNELKKRHEEVLHPEIVQHHLKVARRSDSKTQSFLEAQTAESRLWVAAARGQEWNVSRELRRGARIVNLPDQFALMMSEAHNTSMMFSANLVDSSLETSALHQAISSTLLFSDGAGSDSDADENSSETEEATEPKAGTEDALAQLSKPTLAELNTCKMLSLMLETFPEAVGFADQIGLQPLHYAARLGLSVVVRFLLARGADPNAQPPPRQGHQKFVSPSKHTPRRYTPLHYAILKQDVAVVALLAAHKADPSITDDDPRHPQSALALAKRQRNQVMYHILTGESNDVLDALRARDAKYLQDQRRRSNSAQEASDTEDEDAVDDELVDSILEHISTEDNLTKPVVAGDNADQSAEQSLETTETLAAQTEVVRDDACPELGLSGEVEEQMPWADADARVQDGPSSNGLVSGVDEAAANKVAGGRPKLRKLFTDGTPTDLISSDEDDFDESELSTLSTPSKATPRLPDGRRRRRTTSLPEEQRVFLYVAGRCFRIVSHEELRKWKSDDQLAAENTQRSASEGINNSLLDTRFANTFLNLKTLFDEPTAPASLPDIRPAQYSAAANVRISESAPCSSTAVQMKSAASSSFHKNKSRGAYLGEGADNGHGGRSPRARGRGKGNLAGEHGSGGTAVDGGSKQSRQQKTKPRGSRGSRIHKLSSLHQSSAPSFHHIDVGLGGGYLVEVSRQRRHDKLLSRDGTVIDAESGWLRGIKLSRHMFADHMPNRYEKRIQDCSRPRVEASAWVKMSTTFGANERPSHKKRRYLTMTHEYAMDEPEVPPEPVSKTSSDASDSASVSTLESESSRDSLLTALLGRGYKGASSSSKRSTRIKRSNSTPARRQCAVLRAYKTDQWFRQPFFATKNCLCVYLSGPITIARSPTTDTKNEDEDVAGCWKPIENAMARVTQPKSNVIRVEQSLESWLLSNEVAYDALYRRYSGLFEQKAYTGYEREDVESACEKESTFNQVLPFEVARRIVHSLHLRTLKEWQRFLFSKSSEKWLLRLSAAAASKTSKGDKSSASHVDGTNDEDDFDWDLQVSIFKIPCRPDKVYSESGWISWVDWLCCNKHAEVDVIITEYEFESPTNHHKSAKSQLSHAVVPTTFKDWWSFISESMSGNLHPVEEHA